MPDGPSPKRPSQKKDDPDRIDELLTPVYLVPPGGSRMPADINSDGYTTMEEFQASLSCLAAYVDDVQYRPRFQDSFIAVRDALSTPLFEAGYARMVFVGQHVHLLQRQLDIMLPPGRHKSLVMKALEDVMSRAFLAFMCDEGTEAADRDLVGNEDEPG